MKVLGILIDIVEFAAGAGIRHIGTTILIMVLAIVGLAILFAFLGVASLVIILFAVESGPNAGLVVPLISAAFVGGLAVAAFVMLRIIRRRAARIVLAGFGERGPAVATTRRQAEAPTGPHPTALTAERVRDLDAGLDPESRSPSRSPSRDDTTIDRAHRAG